MNPDDPLPLAIVIVGTVASFILALSPIPLIIRVFKTKDVGFFKPDAFIAAIPFGIANGTYSMYSKQTVSFISTMITFVLYSLYLGIFIHFSKSKRAIYKKIMIAVALGGVITGIGPAIFRIVDSTETGRSWLEDRGGADKFVKTWLGVCATISVAILMSGQVPAMLQVFKTKDARPISLEMTLGGLFASLAWATYASLILDVYYIVSNGLGVTAGCILLVLKLKYKNPPQAIHGSNPSVIFDETVVKDQTELEQSNP
jgi:uncharacterized protein with PQ loop repeat